MLESACAPGGNGTASNIFVNKPYTVAGKTGTSKIAENGGYASGRYRASFTGYFPADDPEFVCIVVIADTKSQLLVLERDRIFDLMEDDFAVLAHVLRFVAGEIIETYLKLDGDYQAPEKIWPIPLHLQVEGRDLDLVERILAIRQVPAFGRSSLDSVARYARLLKEVHVPAGEVLWREGDPCRNYLHVVRGQFRGERRGGCGLLTYGPPSMPGLFGVLSGRERRWYTATVETPIVALQVDRELILDLLEDDFEMAAFCLKLSARRLIRFLSLRDEPATT